MAIAENGPSGHHRGRIGNIVYYVLNGKNVAREIGISTKPFTDLQKQQHLLTKIRSRLFRDLLDFVNTGFGIAAIQAQDNAFNQAIKSNSKIIKGIYPDLEVAYDEILLSKGTLKPVQNWEAIEIGHGLQYNWDTNPEMPWPDTTDQVMLLAYFPKHRKVFHKLFGNSRLSGTDTLEIPPSMQGEWMETYMSFVSADRKHVSDSIYTGNFNVEITEPTL